MRRPGKTEMTDEENAKKIIELRRVINASEALFLRKYLGCTQAELAERIGRSRKTVSSWESRGDIHPASSYLLRGMALAKLCDNGAKNKSLYFRLLTSLRTVAMRKK